MNQTPQSIIINLPAGTAGPALPEFVRLPGNREKETYTGLSRSTILRLMAAGRVESKVVKSNPANTRGCRLIRLRTLLAAIEGGEESAAPPNLHQTCTTPAESNTLPPAA